MRNGDISNTTGSVFGILIKPQVKKSKRLFFLGANKVFIEKDEVDLINYIFKKTNHTVCAVINSRDLNKEVSDSILDLLPFSNIIVIVKDGDAEKLVTRHEIDYLIDKDAESNVNNQWVMSIEEAYTLLGR